MATKLNNKTTKPDIKQKKTIIENPDVRVLKGADFEQLFHIETKNISNYLNSKKQYFDKIDTKYNRNNKELIYKYCLDIKATLDDHFQKILFLYNKLDIVNKNKLQKEYQTYLHPFFYGSPYNKRVYEKPLGYPGDFIMMRYLYENKNEGRSLFDKIIHRYSMLIPTGIANRNRKEFYKNQILECTKNNISPKITSVACGPAYEIFEIIKNTPKTLINTELTLVDFEKKVFHYLKKKFYTKNMNLSYKINYHCINLITLLNSNKINTIIGNQDLIYCSGLLDYFNDKLASKFIQTMYAKLNINGKLIIGNVTEDDSHIAYSELLGEWYLNRRNKNNMLSIAKSVLTSNNHHITYEPETKMNIYLIITKK